MIGNGARIQRLELLRLDGGIEADLVHGGSDDASGDLDASENKDVIAGYPLRFIRSSSSSLPPQVIAELKATFHSPVIEAYGMTEAAHQMTSNPLHGVRKPGSVGLAAGPEVAIMDENGHLLEVGEVGEIVIRGENVTTGKKQ